MITRAVGTEASVEVDTLTLTMTPGDIYLICSDGLTDLVRDEQIAELIATAENDPDAAAEALVDAANRAGGVDNITVVLFEILEGEAPPAPDPAGEPDDDTMEQALESPVAEPVAEPVVPVRRHGAGSGGRWLALAAIVLTAAVAALVVWWSLKR